MTRGRLVQTSGGRVTLGPGVQITLDASGNGSAVYGPQRAGESWQINNTTITCTGALPSNGNPSTWVETLNGAQIDSSYSVLQDQSDTVIELGPGQLLAYSWTNGPAHGVATVAHYGTQSFIRG